MVEKNKCCGCSACYSVCPMNCITMEADELGFYYPKIDFYKCIHCNRCEAVCPSIDREKVKENEDDIIAFGGFSTNKAIRDSSSSGGLFTIIAEQVLSDGGCVFGVSLSNDCRFAHHIKVETFDELCKLRGSKYVQCIPNGIYSDVLQELKKNKIVLFSGTPCQIDGLNLFLGRKYDNLITLEIICHGTSSPRIYEKYVLEMTESMGSPIKQVSFRDELCGNNLIMKIVYANGKIYRKDQYVDPYFRLFLSNNCLRESCYQCPSRGSYQRADITLSDFWGIEKVNPELFDGGGISLYLSHTEKGRKILEAILPSIKGKYVKFEDAIKGNPAYYKSYGRSKKRDTIMYDIESLSLKQLVRKYTYSTKEILKLVLHVLHLTAPIKKALGR